MSRSSFNTIPFGAPAAGVKKTTSAPLADEEVTSPADAPASLSLLDSISTREHDNLQEAMAGRQVSHALASLKGIAPMLNALSASSVPLESEEGLRALETMVSLVDRLSTESLESLGLDANAHPWALPVGRTILAPLVARRWEDNPDLSIEEGADEFRHILQVAISHSLTPEYGSDWDMVQPQTAMAISLSAAVDNVMAEYDHTFNFFQDRKAVVDEVTQTLLDSTRSIIQDIEQETGELAEPGRTRTIQSVIREGGALMGRLWRPEAKLALDDIKSRDRATRAHIIAQGGYPLDRLMTRFKEAHQVHAVVILSGLNFTQEPKIASGMSPG